MAEAKWKYPDDDKHATVANADPDEFQQKICNASMWHCEIHKFLELLRQRMPVSLILAFTSFAYSTMAFLYETVAPFKVPDRVSRRSNTLSFIHLTTSRGDGISGLSDAPFINNSQHG
ncbi:hypothetical protein BGZ57DRAFT_923018 [Hyaloscypha finlandica]|nr:hypothetical protein BGZ57DRAFT_923018 [Hyaloscypha finlandica]